MSILMLKLQMLDAQSLFISAASFFCHQQIITNAERQTQTDSNQVDNQFHPLNSNEIKVCLTLMGF